MKRLRHPIRAIREPFGTAGLIVACLALVLAMGGAAVAAKGGLTGKQKKEVAKIAKKEAKKFATTGPAGAVGPAGPTGPTGPGGAKGDKGDTGGAGSAGTSATTVAYAGPECANGGVEVKSASPTAYVCNGEDGQTGFTETLPSGKTETGAWSLGSTPEGDVPGPYVEPGIIVPISFPIPLETGLQKGHAHYINTEGKEVQLVETGPPAYEYEFKAVAQSNPKPCPGTVASPEAEPGEFCVYEAALNEAGLASQKITDPSNGPVPSPPATTGATGALLDAFFINPTHGPSYGWGTWAVTAE